MRSRISFSLRRRNLDVKHGTDRNAHLATILAATQWDDEDGWRL